MQTPPRKAFEANEEDAFRMKADKLNSHLFKAVYLALTALLLGLLYNGPFTTLIENETAFVEDEILADLRKMHITAGHSHGTLLQKLLSM